MYLPKLCNFHESSLCKMNFLFGPNFDMRSFKQTVRSKPWSIFVQNTRPLLCLVRVPCFLLSPFTLEVYLEMRSRNFCSFSSYVHVVYKKVPLTSRCVFLSAESNKLILACYQEKCTILEYTSTILIFLLENRVSFFSWR